jgi:pSer/pThr/pTyr-binding forkhead associated (FHA) protein
MTTLACLTCGSPYDAGEEFCENCGCRPTADPSVPAPERFVLIVRPDGLASSEYLIPEGETLIGRGSKATCVVLDESVSRIHARFTLSAGIPTYEDLASTNGSELRGTKLAAPTALLPGDILTLGNATIELTTRTA